MAGGGVRPPVAAPPTPLAAPPASTVAARRGAGGANTQWRHQTLPLTDKEPFVCPQCSEKQLPRDALCRRYVNVRDMTLVYTNDGLYGSQLLSVDVCSSGRGLALGNVYRLGVRLPPPKNVFRKRHALSDVRDVFFFFELSKTVDGYTNNKYKHIIRL